MSGDNRLHTSAAITFLYVRLRSFLFGVCVFLYLYGQAAEKEAAGAGKAAEKEAAEKEAAGTLLDADACEEATAVAKVHSGGKNRLHTSGKNRLHACTPAVTTACTMHNEYFMARMHVLRLTIKMSCAASAMINSPSKTLVAEAQFAQNATASARL